MRFLLPAIAVSSALLLPGTVHAGLVPESALAAARLTDPTLVESDALVLAAPQRAVMEGNSLGAFNAQDHAPAALVRWRPLHRLAFALSQQDYLIGTYYSTSDLRLYSGTVAGALGPIRLGAAYRTGHDSDAEEREIVRYSTSDVEWLKERAKSASSIREISFGGGVGSGRVSVDLTVDLRDVDRSGSSHREEADEPTEAGSGTVSADRRWGGSLRAAVPFGASTDLTLAAAFQDLRANTVFSYIDEYQLEQTTTYALYGHVWYAGLDLARQFAEWRAHVHALYRDERDPGVPDSDYQFYLSSRRVDRLEAGVCLERDGWWDSRLFVSAAGVRSRSWAEQTRAETNSSYATIYQDRRRDETRGSSFSWGATRTIGDIDLAGQISTSLSVSNPIATLDARIRF